jgi:hypothetical protein
MNGVEARRIHERREPLDQLDALEQHVRRAVAPAVAQAILQSTVLSPGKPLRG